MGAGSYWQSLIPFCPQRSPRTAKLRFRLTCQSSTPPRQLKGQQPQITALTAVVQDYVQSQLMMISAAALRADPAPQPKAQTAAGIFLMPQGLTQHRLHLGSLARQPAEWVLGTLELADLATVLESFDAEMVTLPPARSRPRWQPLGYAGAAGLLLAVGLATWLNSPHSTFETAQTSGDEAAQTLAESAPEDLEPPENSGPSDSTAPITPTPESARSGDRPSAPTTQPPAEPSDQAAAPITPKTQPTPSASAPADPAGSQASQPVVPATPAPATAAPTAAADVAPAEAERANTDAIASAPPPDQLSQNSSGLAAPAPLQLAEVQQYLEATWQPPADLKNTLIYDWVLAADGSVTEINPVSPAAAAYRDRLSIFVGDRPIFSPTGGAELTIRITLKPSGEVAATLP
ncbi:MAG: DUF4335 domain-containing protein [Leptolyngbyaceae cyanobacterium SL_1_1]|nr:DUF4335 domain-containing protein [Leptolyngbyaceae cyanobacterium SL_1_1]